jgi:hypothetical protein
VGRALIAFPTSFKYGIIKREVSMNLVSVTAIYDDKDSKTFIVKDVDSFKKILPLFFSHPGKISLGDIKMTESKYEAPKSFYYCTKSRWHALFKLPFPKFKEAPTRTREGYYKAFRGWRKAVGLGKED